MAKVLKGRSALMLKKVFNSCAPRQASRIKHRATQVELGSSCYSMPPVSKLHGICGRKTRLQWDYKILAHKYSSRCISSSKTLADLKSTTGCLHEIASKSEQNSQCLDTDLSLSISSFPSITDTEYLQLSPNESLRNRLPQKQFSTTLGRNKHNVRSELPHLLPSQTSRRTPSLHSLSSPLHHSLYSHLSASVPSHSQMATYFSTLSSSMANHHLPRSRDFPQSSLQAVCSSYSTASRIVESSPKSLQPYLKLIRMDKPIGTWLLYWPCTWSIALASGPGNLPDFYLLALFGAGAFFMRGAGCIINDMWDKDFDGKVERTKTRPLASGDLTQFQALVFLGSQLSCALAILLQLNLYSILLGAASMGLVITYPLAKRYTYWPQFILGLTFNYGVLLGYAAVAGSVDWAVCLPMYGASVLWTLVYDTVYAHQDKSDDLLIGVKSAAIRLGEHTKPVLTVFTAAMAAGLMTSGYMADMTWPYYLAVALTTGRLTQQVCSTDMDVADQCAHAFRGNFYLGAIMFVGIVLSNYLKGGSEERGWENSEEDIEKEYSERVREEISEPKKDTILFMPR